MHGNIFDCVSPRRPLLARGEMFFWDWNGVWVGQVVIETGALTALVTDEVPVALIRVGEYRVDTVARDGRLRDLPDVLEVRVRDAIVREFSVFLVALIELVRHNHVRRRCSLRAFL